jgi:hypothetical protein
MSGCVGVLVSKKHAIKNDAGRLCFYCSCTFNGPPATIPIGKENGKWVTKHRFCSWSCAKRHILQTEHLVSSMQCLYLIDLAHSFGYKGNHIRASPHRELLICFGGNMTYEQFHANRKVVGLPDIIQLQPPFIPYPTEYLNTDTDTNDSEDIRGELSSGVHGLRRPPIGSCRSHQRSGVDRNCRYVKYIYSRDHESVTPRKVSKRQRRKLVKGLSEYVG